MLFKHKSYSNHYKGPNPTVVFDNEKKFLAISFCWGVSIDASNYLNQIKSHFTSQTKDLEMTRPIPFKTDLDFYENCLRSSVALSNNQFYRSINKEDYKSGLELFICTQIGHALYYIKTGQPNLLINRNKELRVLSSEVDLATEFKVKDLDLSPLPKKLFGTFENTEFNLNKIHCKKNDQLMLIKRSSLGKSYNKKTIEISLEEFSSHLIKDNQDLPFWLGSIVLD